MEQNLETMSLEDLKALANTPETDDRPRNPDGTFAAKTDDQSETPAEKVVYQKVIDLGDGSGVQVFRADSQEELIDKLVDAQFNATKKIRDLNAQLPKPARKERSADEEFILSQELMTNPSKALEKAFQEMVGMPMEAFKTKIDKVNAFEAAQAANQAAVDFVAQTPDYHATPANQARMTAYLNTYKLPYTVESITKAFHDLTASGLLETKTTQTTPQTTSTTPAPRSSGLSTRGAAAPTRTSTAPTEAELYAMPLHKLAELANAQ